MYNKIELETYLQNNEKMWKTNWVLYTKMQKQFNVNNTQMKSSTYAIMLW